MLRARRTSALRRRRSAGLAVACGAAVALATAGLTAAAAAAPAGQIVWTASNGIWAMNDDGTGPHELLSAASPPLAARLPAGTVTEPDVFQNGGTTVLFLGMTGAFADPSLPQACGADCAGTFELRNGTLTQLGPAAAAASGAAYYESQPRITANGHEIFGSSLYTGITASSLGTPATALVERALSQNATVTQWSNSNGEVQPTAGFDGTPDPADPTLAAWVEAQGCSYHVVDAQSVSHSSCQYAVHLGTASSLAAPIIIYDNEYASSSGRGPTSLALSGDGATLMLVDPSAPNTGIYETPVAGVPGSKPVSEILAQPAGWTFGQARFAGSKIVFDAHQQANGKTTGDIYTIPATCGSATACSFPASATDLTNNPAADASDPAWTSATATLAPLRVAATPRITSVKGPAAAVRAGHTVNLVVKLSAAAKIVIKIVRRQSTALRAKTIGTVTFAGRSGANRLAITRVGGHTLAAGSYTATLSVRGPNAAARTVHFSVKA
jgi:hypothetical protein